MLHKSPRSKMVPCKHVDGIHRGWKTFDDVEDEVEQLVRGRSTMHVSIILFGISFLDGETNISKVTFRNGSEQLCNWKRGGFFWQFVSSISQWPSRQPRLEFDILTQRLLTSSNFWEIGRLQRVFIKDNSGTVGMVHHQHRRVLQIYQHPTFWSSDAGPLLAPSWWCFGSGAQGVSIFNWLRRWGRRCETQKSPVLKKMVSSFRWFKYSNYYIQYNT